MTSRKPIYDPLIFNDLGNRHIIKLSAKGVTEVLVLHTASRDNEA